MSLSDLTYEQIEAVCDAAEKAARGYILSKIHPRRVADLAVTVDVGGERPLTVKIAVEMRPSSLIGDADVKRLMDEAIEEAFLGVEKVLEELRLADQEDDG
ncbi:MAG: DUF3194 domain-containing protein [Candidatus Bathyarchaeia archaeon]